MADVSQAPQYRRVIRPNRSLSRRLLLGVLGTYLAIETGIGVGFLLKGAWPILPFAGLEILVVGAVLYVLSRHRGDCEVVVVDDAHLTVVRRQGAHQSQHEFQRYWTRVRLRRDAKKWYPSRLWVGSHGHFVEIGASMEEAEREALARDLRQVIER